MALVLDQMLIGMAATQCRSVDAPTARTKLGLGSFAVLSALVDGTVTNAKLANVNTSTIKGRATAGSGAPEDLTGAQVKTILAIAESDVTNLVTDLAAKAPTARLINTTAPLTGGGDLTADRTFGISDATATTRGAVPTPPNDTTKFLRGDATWAAPPASGLSQQQAMAIGSYAA